MVRTLISSLSVLIVVASALGACAHLGGASQSRSGLRALSPSKRLAAIRHAKVWTKTDVRSINMKVGPADPGAFQPNQTVSCDYVDKQSTGRSPKFTCAISPEDEVKVKYGQDNGEVFAEVAAARLFWALGFGSDHMYPVRVICRGCPHTLTRMPEVQGNTVIFRFAAIERKMPGHEIETRPGSGWSWLELDLVDPEVGGASRAERDALKLLAVIVQHTDTKPEQQRLLCMSKHKDQIDEEQCPETFMMVSDLGQTFGRGNIYNRDSIGSVNLAEWSTSSVWKNPKRCIGNLRVSVTGTLENPSISEEGRKFLADLLVQLTDTQLRDLFEVARFPDRLDDKVKSGTTVDDWVKAFKRKRGEVINHTCPS